MKSTSSDDSDSVVSIGMTKKSFLKDKANNLKAPVTQVVLQQSSLLSMVAAQENEECNSQIPDNSVLLWHNELKELQANQFGTDRFSLQDKMQLELLQILKSHQLPLNTFAPTLQFAIKLNSLGISLSHAPKTRKTIIAKLFKHYHMESLFPNQNACLLPIAQISVPIVYFNASAVFASLLSCPRLNQDHKYMFRDPNNIFASPADTMGNDGNVIGEINTGAIYNATYLKLVVDRGKDMLLPAIFGLDKTHIDSSSRLQMEPLTVSHGLLKHEFRSHPSAMRILGYINLQPVHYTASRLPMSGETRMTVAAAKLNDYHAQIEFILQESGFLQLQNYGFSWNLQFGGQVYPVVFRLYVPFIVGDTEGHDRLCGHYTARFEGIQQLCRVCKCPTKLSSYSKGVYKKRYPDEIQTLIANKNDAGLRSISQTFLLRNGFSKVCFGFRPTALQRPKPDRGIFGACPGEILHLVLLGWFKYCMDAFILQMGGPKTTSAALFDDLCADIGRSLQRQSDREVPRTNFPKGFSTVANLKGHEIVGCLVVMLFAVQTSQFRSIFSSPRHSGEGKFGNDIHIADWILLLESLLQWHQWLKKPTMSKFVVMRSSKTMRWLMRKFQNIAHREKGMQHNTIKMHLVLHLAEDILDHGVPHNVNSAFTESAHIPLAKDTSRNTQKRGNSFTYQAAKRYVENLALELAFYETAVQQPLDTPLLPIDLETATNKSQAAGLYNVYTHENGHDIVYQWHSTTRQKEQSSGLFEQSEQLTGFLKQRILSHLPVGTKVPCYTEFETSAVSGDCKSQLYRAHPYFQEKPWFDCATIRWQANPSPDNPRGNDIELPAKLHAFIDLRNTDLCTTLNLATLDLIDEDPIEPDFYVICESYDRVPAIVDANEETSATIIGVFHRTNNHLSEPILYLVSTQCIIAPIFGMCDIAVKNPPMKFINKKSRHHYASKPPCEPYYLFFVQPQSMWAQCWEDRILTNVDEGEVESAEEGDELLRK